MSSFFNLDNPFFTGLNKIVDAFFLSIIFLVTCIPIITIGPALTALYYATAKSLRRDRGYISKEYFKAFKMNFGQGVVSGLVVILASFILYIDWNYAKGLKSNVGVILFSIFTALFVILFCISIYLFPVLSRFKTKTLHLFKTSFLMSMRHLPSTILMAIIVLFFVLLVYLFRIPILFAPALCALLVSFLMERIFKKYIPQKEEEEESNGVDEWYLE
ncbi:YesL family protein [Anaerocolumna jejuensis]|uniref:YesL family protein n=1 Tax=Anaerocolumna jejuensis TaxID=259063 RepID=UPI003F7B8639